MQRENLVKLKTKAQSITRLRQELLATKKASGINVDALEALTPEEADSIDDLKSKLELLRKEYFVAIGFNIKLLRGANIEIHSLYTELPPDLSITEWSSWLERKIDEKMQEGGHERMASMTPPHHSQSQPAISATSMRSEPHSAATATTSSSSSGGGGGRTPTPQAARPTTSPAQRTPPTATAPPKRFASLWR